MATSNYSPYDSVSKRSSSSGSSSSESSKSSSSSKSGSVSPTVNVTFSSLSGSGRSSSSPYSSVSYTPSRSSASSLSGASLSGGSSSSSGNSLRGKNLRGSDPGASIKRTGVTASSASSISRSSANPTAAEVADIGKQLAALNDYAQLSSAEKRRADRKEAGIEPSPGLIDWNGMIYDFNAPYRKRAERAGGAPFEGPVDWGGIAAALFGGQSAEERDAALAEERAAALAEERAAALAQERLRPDPARSTPWSPDNAIMQALRGGGDRPLEGTGPEGSRLVADASPIPFPSLDGLDALAALAKGLKAEGLRQRGELPLEVDTAYAPGMPREDPRGYPSDDPLPGPVEDSLPVEIIVVGGSDALPGESDEARYARLHPVAEPEKKTVWDQVVEGAGGLAEKTGWGSLVKNLFPDFWYDTGEAMKGIDDGVRYGGSGVRTNFEDTANGGSLIEQPVQYAYAPAMLPFPDVNGNGIDDRLEGLGAVNGNNRPRTAVFPTMPPFRPGTDAEWQYFRDGYAEGGMVGGSDPLAAMENILTLFAQGELSAKDTQKALRPFGYKANLRSKYGNTVELEPLGTGDFITLKFAEGGVVDTDLDEPVNSGNLHRDPRMALIADAEDAIENYAEGEPEPDDETALRKFVEAFGDGALRELAANVAQGLKLRERRTGRLVRGPGGPKDDAIPAVITEEGGGQRPAALSDGEYVFPVEAVEGAGEGDHEAGAERLQRLSNMLSRRGAA